MTTRKLQGPLGGDYQTDGAGNAVLLNAYPLTQEDDVPLRLADHEARVTAAEAGLLSGQSHQLGWGPTVVCVGDSITAGNCDMSKLVYMHSWAMEMALASGGQIPMPYIHATGGWTSAQAIAGLAAVLDAQLPDVVLEAIGINDTLDGSNLPTTTMTNIAAMHQMCKDRGIAFVMGLISPQGNPALATPSAPTLTVEATGGTMSASSPQYKVAYANTNGLTLPSAAATATISSGSANAVVVQVPYVAGAAGFDVFKSTDGGATFGRIAQVRTGGGQSRWVTLYRDTGATPSGVTPPVSNTTAQAAIAASQRKISVMNAAKRAYAQANGVPLIDFYAATADPATGLYKAGYSFDGTHPGSEGQRARGQAAWATVGPLFRPNKPYGMYYNGDPYNLMQDGAGNPNGMFGLNDGAKPTGWSVYSGGATGTSNTTGVRSGHNGNALAVVRTALLDSRIADSPGPAATAGHVYVVAGTFELVGAGALATIQIRFAGAASQDQFTLWFSQETAPVRFQSPPIVAPAGSTALWIRASLASNAPGTMAMSEITIYDLTALGLA